jgi:hypothetical protein
VVLLGDGFSTRNSLEEPSYRSLPYLIKSSFSELEEVWIFQKNLGYLDYVDGGGELKINPRKIVAILNWPT